MKTSGLHGLNVLPPAHGWDGCPLSSEGILLYSWGILSKAEWCGSTFNQKQTRAFPKTWHHITWSFENELSFCFISSKPNWHKLNKKKNHDLNPFFSDKWTRQDFEQDRILNSKGSKTLNLAWTLLIDYTHKEIQWSPHFSSKELCSTGTLKFVHGMVVFSSSSQCCQISKLNQIVSSFPSEPMCFQV